MKLAGLPQHVAAPNPDLYWSDNYVVVDFETTTQIKGSPLDPSNRIVLACWSEPNRDTHKREGTGLRPDGAAALLVRDDGRRMRVRFGSEYDMGDLVEAIHAAEFVVAHNAKFESGWLRRCGVDLRKLITFDTMIAEHVIGGNKHHMQHLGLNATLKRHGFASKRDTIGLMFKAGYDTLEMPESWLEKYCIRDVEACEELFLAQREKLKALKLESINYQRNLVTPCLADIETNGMQLDVAEVLKMEKTIEDEYAKATNEFQTFCEGASPSSPKQQREFIYNNLKFRPPCDYRGNPICTPSGDYSVAADVLLKLRADNDRQQRYLDLRKKWARLHSDLTKYVRKFADCCRADSGLLHGNFNQCSTRTHRLSSSGTKYAVQFQNFNRNFKPLFHARTDGWLLGEADGAQLEFRIATHLGRDAVALRDITTGTDIHAYTASIIGCTRQEAKPHTFKPLYGGKSGAPAEVRYYEAFTVKYSGISDAQHKWTHQVNDSPEKMLVTEWGMRYYYPGTYQTQTGYITNSTSIYNYPVQALATAEIIPCALVCAWHRMKDMKSFLINTVHDSIIGELHPDEVDLWHELAQKTLITDCYMMMKKLYDLDLTVPLGAGVMIGTHWGDKVAKDSEVVYEADESMWKDAAVKEGMI